MPLLNRQIRLIKHHGPMLVPSLHGINIKADQDNTNEMISYLATMDHFHCKIRHVHLVTCQLKIKPLVEVWVPLVTLHAGFPLMYSGHVLTNVHFDVRVCK